MKNVMFRGSRRGVQRPLRKGHGAVAAALVTASGVAALAFAPSAQAASSYNVMLTKVPAGVNSVSLWDHNTESGTAGHVGCFQVQSGKDTNTGYKVSAKHKLKVYMNTDSDCWLGGKGLKYSATVTDNLGTTNFWFSLSW